MNWRRLIPNSISSASLIFGVLSIFKTIEGDFFLAPVFIVIAVIFDSMDGRAARALGVGGGDFGKEMDSLCDMCSFGVGACHHDLYVRSAGFGPCRSGYRRTLRCRRLPASGTLQLQHRCCTRLFSGHAYSGRCLLLGNLCCFRLSIAPAVLAAVTLVIACIMYSEVKFPDFKGKGNPMYRLPVIIAVIVGAVMLYGRPGAWPFVAMFTYTLAGIVNHVYRALTGKNK